MTAPASVPPIAERAGYGRREAAAYNRSMSTDPPVADRPPLEFDASVQFVPGVGPKRAKLFAKLGVETVEDLLWLVPRALLDFSRVTDVADLEDGVPVTVRGTVVDRDNRNLPGRRSLTTALLECPPVGGEETPGAKPAYVRAAWFNQGWQYRKVQAAHENESVVLVTGKPKFKSGYWEFTHPQWHPLPPEDVGEEGVGLLPKYPLTDGLKQPAVRRATRAATEALSDRVADPMSDDVRARLDVGTLRESVRGMHTPATAEQFELAMRRLRLGDLFEFQLGLALRRRAWKTGPQAPPISTTAKVDARIRRLFPFRFTNGQDAAIADIREDLSRSTPMHRLLQADVGAGKTVVALYAILAAVAAGTQAVLMAPTELLASQHWGTVEDALAHSRVRRALLTGRLTAGQRRETLAKIAAGEVDLVVGTQAVIQKDVTFARLGVVVIDEQHKFGVAQRSHFSRDAAAGEPGDAVAMAPHVLVMTATPIPRSLCMTQFGDLDLSLINERPPGRQPVTTARVLTQVQRQKMWDFVCRQVAAGRQAYVVSPRVDGAGSDATGAEQLVEQLRAGPLRGLDVGLVHGQMDRDARTEVMDAFRDGELHAIVATTVIEVGVDVPNATVMVIEDAGAFGLSQLHQLRGRIGRGKHRSYCFLVSDAESSGGETGAAASRLEVMEQTDDGFEIAERDFEIRGGGDVLGTRQSGETPLRFADVVRDRGYLAPARKAAFAVVADGSIDAPENAALKRLILDRFGELMDLPRSG